MSVETSMAQAANAAEAAAAAATEASGAATVDAAIATAQDAIANAQEVAADIAAAAMESERGRRLENLCEEFDQWREESETRITDLETKAAEILAGIASLSTMVETLKATAQAPTTIVTLPEASASSTPPTSMEEPPTAIVTTVEPGAAHVVAAVPLEAETKRRRARFIG